jgi:hypothetical protein
MIARPSSNFFSDHERLLDRRLAVPVAGYRFFADLGDIVKERGAFERRPSASAEWLVRSYCAASWMKLAVAMSGLLRPTTLYRDREPRAFFTFAGKRS